MESQSESALGRGGDRRVGIEIEFGRLDARRAAEAVRARFGGTAEAAGPHRVRVVDTSVGDFVVELDWRFVHDKADDNGILDQARDLLGDVGREVVPTEVVSPPMPADRVGDFDALVRDLRQLGAEGTRGGLLNGFGLHLNPELWPADRQADPIRRVLQAYLLKSGELRSAIGVDPVRSLLPFVEQFPARYADKVLAPDYRPDLDRLIDDYMADNPTRNRELDMLVLFTELDAERVRRALRDPLVSARPTFHWRLPNADLEDPNWSVEREWDRWLSVERLACDEAALADALADRQRTRPVRSWASLF